MSRTHARVTQADIARAIRAAKQAGVDMAVEILPDGTIRIARTENRKEFQEIGPKREIVL